jgi:hypothetical protein
VVSTTYHFDSLTRTRHLFLGAREAGSDNDYCYLYRLCSVMFVCRKMYAETHMLPFQMCTFYFPCDLENPQAWAELLGNDHFQAICHIRVGYTWLKYHLVRRHFYLQRYLSALPKLKRVVVCHCSSKIGASKADIISSIHKGCSRSDVEVVFELTKTTLKVCTRELVTSVDTILRLTSLACFTLTSHQLLASSEILSH